MTATELARWQFGIVTVYHFIFVPLTLGLGFLVAGFQTAWYRTDNPMWLRATKFWGKLFLINFAIGVVTGIVQEFQFGMNWSDYSRFVGDVFGAPLAMEGLLAFFLESTFLGLWIFGWDKLPRKAHLATIWLAAIGTNISAYFILAANSWMQHPVGYVYDPVKNRAHLTSIWKVLTNSTVLAAFPHTITAGFVTAGALVIGVSAWHLARSRDTELFRRCLRVGLIVTLVAGVGTSLAGHVQGQIMTEQQPMKMAAAEALWDTEASAGFSLFAVGDIRNGRNHVNIQVPYGLSMLATNHPHGTVQGINDVQRAEVATYGPGDYRPVVGITYWTFRLMMGFGFLAAGISLVGLWLTRRQRVPTNRWFTRVAVWGIGLPFLASAMGWIFTEMGRQPWAVFGVLKVSDAVSPGVGVGTVATSLIVYTLLYAALAVVEFRLMVRYVRYGAPEVEERDDVTEPTLAFSY